MWRGSWRWCSDIPVCYGQRARMSIQIVLPPRLAFKNHDVYDFESALRFIDWSIADQQVVVDFTHVRSVNYQTLALLVPYLWHLRCHGCRIELRHDHAPEGASAAWRRLGARGWSRVLSNQGQNFKGNQLIALRGQEDFSRALARAEEFAKNFNVEYEKTLRYVVSELLYNALEHGAAACAAMSGLRIPALIQFSWYKERNELHFLVADLGVGIKRHLEQSYPPFADDAEAIRKSLEPQVSGTFGTRDPYSGKNNAGMGLFISSNIVRRVHADMHIVSGAGLVHVSPRDVTSRILATSWPGTFVLVAVRLGALADLNLYKLMTEAREEARRELESGSRREAEQRFLLHIRNYFGPYAEDKLAATQYRDRHLLPAVDRGEAVLIDFDGVVSAPHSFLSALLATAVQRMGMQAYKRIRVINASPEIRETIDYVLDENTTGGFTNGTG